jgi:hypothetical protein
VEGGGKREEGDDGGGLGVVAAVVGPEPEPAS